MLNALFTEVLETISKGAEVRLAYSPKMKLFEVALIVPNENPEDPALYLHHKATNESITAAWLEAKDAIEKVKGKK